MDGKTLPYELLIVDDEEIIRNGLSQTIDWPSLGFRVAGTTMNGAAALEFIAERHVDAVLADIRMPKLSGLELAREIKVKRPGMRVVLLSGYDTFRYAQEAIDQGVFSYLLKPSKTEDIIEVFTRLRHSLDKEREATVVELMDGDDHASIKRSISLALRLIAERYAEDLSLDSIASYIEISPAYFCRLFKRETGVNFKDYLTDFRLEKAKEALRDPRRKVYEIAEAVGFRDNRYFSEIFKKRVGLSPLEFRDASR
jgi:YesN/AraC family two-component response regulator